MNAISILLEEMAAGITEDTGIRSTTDLGTTIPDPVAIIGPPQIEFEGFCTDGLAEMRIKVFVIGSPGEKVTEVLLDSALPVAACIESRFGGAVRSANPIDYSAGGYGDRPAYELNVEIGVSLDIP